MALLNDGVVCRYRTQLCNEPATCRRKVCFFAHTLEELREPSLEEFALIPAAWPANGKAARRQHNRAVAPPPRALEAVAKVQEALAAQHADLRRLEISQQQRVHGQSPVYVSCFCNMNTYTSVEGGVCSVQGYEEPTPNHSTNNILTMCNFSTSVPR